MDPITGIAFVLGAGSFLFDAFDKSLQAYGIYSTAKSLANVSAHLVAKLLIEERRLIQWGDGVGIKPVAQTAENEASELDERLRENDALLQTVLQALAGIEETLTDIADLTAKYGLQVFEEENVASEESSKNDTVLPILPHRPSQDSVFNTDRPGLSETLKLRQDQSRRIQTSTSIRKKFRWAIRDKSGFEMLLDRLRYYNDSLYCLLPKESVKAIERDVLASLIDAASSQRLLQYATVASPSEERVQGNFTNPQYSTIASAAKTSLQMADVDPLPTVNVWFDETSISYDGENSQIGTISRQGCAPTRVYVEKKTPPSYENFCRDRVATKEIIDRVKELALLLREPRHFGFATLPCIGVVLENMDREGFFGEGKVKLVYELPLVADPLAHLVSLHDLLSLDEYRLDEPPEIDVRFQLVTSLTKALHEMHCTGWLHRDISSNSILFLKTRPGSGIEALDLEKPYMAGFDAARSFAANRSPGYLIPNYDALIYKHPGYLLHRMWSQYRPRHGNTGDQLFHMPRHDYYSMGLVFLEIGMWRSLQSLLLHDVQQTPYSDGAWEHKKPKTTLGRKLKSLTRDVVAARLNKTPATGEVTDEERSRREHVLANYVSEGPKLIEEEGLTDIVLNESFLHGPERGNRNAWGAWDRAIRICQEKLGSRMGRRYREAVRRCLATDFGISPGSSKNLDWLRAYNWRVVQELNRCCA